MAQIIPFPVRPKAAVPSAESPQVELPEAGPRPEAEQRPDAASPPEAEQGSEAKPPVVVVPPRPLSAWKMMGCAVFAVFGAGLLLVVMSLLAADPLDGDFGEGAADSKGGVRSSGGGSYEGIGPAWFFGR